MYTVYWDEHHKKLSSLAQVDDLLDKLHARFKKGDPTLVTVELAGSEDSLSIGLGIELSVLNYVRGDKNPPYYTSVGGNGADEAISFRFGGEWSEFPLRNAIPIGVARAAMKQFCETGRLPQNLEWEEV